MDKTRYDSPERQEIRRLHDVCREKNLEIQRLEDEIATLNEKQAHNLYMIISSYYGHLSTHFSRKRAEELVEMYQLKHEKSGETFRIVEVKKTHNNDTVTTISMAWKVKYGIKNEQSKIKRNFE